MNKYLKSKEINASGLANVFQLDTLTFPAKAGVTIGDYINVYDQAGTHYAVQLDTTGSDTAPSGALWVAADETVQCDISAATDAASVAAAVEISINTLTGFTAAITTDDTAADGTMKLTQVVAGVTDVPVPKDEDDSGAGSITTDPTTTGFAQPNITSDGVDIRYCYGFSVGYKWVSTTAAATIKLQESLDGIVWVDVADSTVTINNNSSSSIIHFDAKYSSFVRAVLTYTSGTVTSAEATIVIKG